MTKLSDLALFPAYSKDYTVEQRMYLQDRLKMLRNIVEAIAAVDHDASPEEKAILRLKFWAQKPRMTDAAIMQQLGMGRATFYRHVNNICKNVGAKIGTDI